MILTLDSHCSSKQLLGALGINTGAGHCQKAEFILSEEAPKLSSGDAGSIFQMASRAVPATQKLLEPGQPISLSEQQCAGCSAWGHHGDTMGTSHTLLLLPPCEPQALQERPHWGSSVLGVPGTLKSASNTHSKGGLWKFRWYWESALPWGVQPGEEQVVLQWHRTPASCWHPDFGPQQIIQSPVDTGLTDLGQKGSELI